MEIKMAKIITSFVENSRVVINKEFFFKQESGNWNYIFQSAVNKGIPGTINLNFKKYENDVS